MKKILTKAAAFLLIICTLSSTCVYAAPQKKYQPNADVYTEGIYNFESGIGNKLNFKLVTPDKSLIVMIIEENNLKYFAQLTANFKEAEITLNDPLKMHTAVLVGDGQLSFTFQ